MPRRKHNKNKDTSRGGPSRGGAARGSSNNGRGFRGRGRGRGFQGRGGYIPSSDTDFILQVWENNNDDSRYSYSSPRGRGRGIGSVPQTSSPSRGYDSRGRGGRGRGRARGGFDSPSRSDFKSTNPNAPLSMLLRPLLRPVIFVPATQHRFLFQVEEELIQPIVEEAGNTEESHVPTADKIARVFSGNFKPTPPETDDDDSSEDLEEIDFADVGKFQEAVNSLASAGKMKLVEQVAEETFTGKFKPVVRGSPVEPPATPDPFLESIPKSNLDTVMAEPDGTIESTSETTSVRVTTTQTEDSNIAEAPLSPTIQSKDIQEDVESVQETSGFFIDVDPSNSPYENETPISDRISGRELGSAPDDDGDDIVVYVAPHPRPGRKVLTPVETPIEPVEIRTTSVLTGLPFGTAHVPDPGTVPTMDSISFSFGSGAREATDMNVVGSTPSSRFNKPPVFTARQQTSAQLKSRHRSRWVVKQRRRKGTSSFAARGADVSEAQLTNWKRDPRRDEQRRGDSDVDWGDDDEGDDDEWEDEKEEEEGQVITVGGLLNVVSSARTRSLSGAEGMDVDPELEIDIEAMKRFAEGMGPSGSRHVTAGDLADEQRMREEDDDGDLDGISEEEEESDEEEDKDKDDEVEEILNLEERMLIAEPADDDEDDEDDDQSPNASFQARLERLRKESQNSSGKRKNKGKGKAKAPHSDDDEDDEDDNEWARNRSWAEEDEDFIAHIHDILDKNQEIINGRDRKSKNKVFTAVFNGDFEDVDMQKPARKAKDKHKDLPPELVDLWREDRAKKALFKKERELARLAAAADPLVQNKGGKKGRKAMLAAAKLDPTITVLPNRVIDMTTLVQQIKRFIDDIGGPRTMSLPPANKQTRKEVHELAEAFGLKSQSKGKDDSRYTTLIKTTKSGVGVNHKKVAKIVRRSGLGGNAEFVGGSDIWKKHAERNKGMPRHREGDEVGKTAPKINETNIGFKMLASMGWTDGASIGLSGGLQNPLTAVIKNTKLGLGAAK